MKGASAEQRETTCFFRGVKQHREYSVEQYETGEENGVNQYRENNTSGTQFEQQLRQEEQHRGNHFKNP